MGPKDPYGILYYLTLIGERARESALTANVPLPLDPHSHSQTQTLREPE
jgi:hypothetical protein